MSEYLFPDVTFTDNAGADHGTGDGVNLKPVAYGMMVFSCGAKATIEIYDDEAATGAGAPVHATFPSMVINLPTGGSFSPDLGSHVKHFRRGCYVKLTQGADIFCGFYGV